MLLKREAVLILGISLTCLFVIIVFNSQNEKDKPNQISICPVQCPGLDSNQHNLADAAT